MRTFRLTRKERDYLGIIMNKAVLAVQIRDIKKCAEYACRVITGDKNELTKAINTLREVVIEKIRCSGTTMFRFLLHRHEAFKTLPMPLRGKALCRQAKDLGLDWYSV